jgi:hypothetical protein
LGCYGETTPQNFGGRGRYPRKGERGRYQENIISRENLIEDGIGMLKAIYFAEYFIYALDELGLFML